MPSASEVGADPSGTAETKVSNHNTDTEAHNDIRLLLTELITQVNSFLDVDDTTRDQLSELLRDIDANKTSIESIISGKVNVTDIINNLTTNVTNKPLSAAQGVVLKGLIDELQTALNNHIADGTTHITAEERAAWDAKQPAGSYALQSEVDSLSEKIADKLPKNQGSANVGKILVVGTDGNLVLTEMPEGGASGDVIGTFDEANNILLEGNIAIGTYTLSYVDEDGNLTGTGSLVVSEIAEPEPAEPTNLADPTSADWQDGYRLSISSGSTAALAGHTTTNYIPCTNGDVLRIKGMTITGYTTQGDAGTSAKIVYYDSSKAKLGGLYGSSNQGVAAANSYETKVTTDGDISTYTIMLNDSGSQAVTGIAYIRIDGLLIDGYTSEDVIITINEEISSDAPDTPDEPTYTNLLPLSVDANGNDYKGTNGEDGYKAGYKMSGSSGNESATTGAYCSGFIPVAYRDTVRIKNVVMSNTASVNNLVFYDANKTRLIGYAGLVGSFTALVGVANGVYKFSPNAWSETENCAFFRFSCGGITDETIVTVNEEIV